MRGPSKDVRHSGTDTYSAPFRPVRPAQPLDQDDEWDLAPGLSCSCGDLKVKCSLATKRGKIQFSLSLFFRLLLPFLPHLPLQASFHLSLSLFLSPSPSSRTLSPAHHLSATASVGQTEREDGGAGIGGTTQLVGVNLVQPRARCRRKPGEWQSAHNLPNRFLT